jgi:hypothetical protein
MLLALKEGVGVQIPAQQFNSTNQTIAYEPKKLGHLEATLFYKLPQNVITFLTQLKI